MKKTQKTLGAVMIAFMLLFYAVPLLWAAEIKDTESATHGADASSHQVVDTYSFPGFKVIQFQLPVLSVYSYLLISNGEALVVDPVRDIFAYLEAVKKENATIKGVYLSHSHADFVAGHMEIVNAVKCPVIQNKKSGAIYKTVAVGEGDTFNVGNAQIKFMETPGHTPDGMCAVIYGKDQPDSALMMFTGDVLFVGSVGRPDLLEGTVSAAWLAGAMFDSWNQKILPLGDAVKIFPAHGAGSLCGAHLSDEPYSTIGKEKTSNPYVRHRTRSAFVAALLDGLPEAPQYFKHNAKMNREGPPTINWNAPVPKEVTAGKDLMDPEKYYIVDVRDARDHAAGHIPGAINIGIRGRFETWTGIMVPWGSKLALVGSKEELKEALYRLHRIGYTAETLTMDSWQKAGLPIAATPPVSPKELYDQMQKGTAPVVVDVRLPSEWMALKIGTVLNLPLNKLSHLSVQLDPEEPVVAVCNSAYRSSLAIGIFERRGFKKPMSLEGGSEAWIKSGLPVFEATAAGRAAIAEPKRHIKLAERMSASDLNRLMMDLPGTFDLVDIRPLSHFKDFNLPGSRNVDIAELLNNTAYLVGPSPLIIVDRDGSLAMMVGGILSQKTSRPIKVLFGGLDAYWSSTHTPSADFMKQPALKSEPPPPTVVVPLAPDTPATQPATEPPKPKRKSAGC